MKEYLYNYIKEIDKLLESDKKISTDVIERHLIKISFFQHERLIHLYVTLFYAIMFLLFSGLGLVHYIFFIISTILLIFLIFYIIHYFRLENGVQYLYKQYDKMIEKN
ncbi:MAG: hypothetical protein IJL76_00380 [Bacilli bacterium]|nr:hypothetical protein [Bacilli bacterium]